MTCINLGLEANIARIFTQLLSQMKFSLKINNITLHAIS